MDATRNAPVSYRVVEFSFSPRVDLPGAIGNTGRLRGGLESRIGHEQTER